MSSPAFPPPAVTFRPAYQLGPQHGPSGARPGRQHERRLLAAFEALDVFPCLGTSRKRVLAMLDGVSIDVAAAVAVIESDLALATRLMREARAAAGGGRDVVGSVRDAVRILGPAAVRGLVATAPTVDFFARSGVWVSEPIHYRRHATAVQAALHRIAARTSVGDLDRLLTAAVLHDIGKLVLTRAHAGFVEHPVGERGTPEQRLFHERRLTGVDHAVVGGVLVRRWGLAPSLARLVECHHVEEPTADFAALAALRLADALANFGGPAAVAPSRMMTLARRAGLDREQLRELLFDQDAVGTAARRDGEPNPLSDREIEVLRLLSEGLVYKQIGNRLDLATSTIRTHLHNIYAKVGAVDRAQAVLIAVRSGWI